MGKVNGGILGPDVSKWFLICGLHSVVKVWRHNQVLYPDVTCSQPVRLWNQYAIYFIFQRNKIGIHFVIQIGSI